MQVESLLSENIERVRFCVDNKYYEIFRYEPSIIQTKVSLSPRFSLNVVV